MTSDHMTHHHMTDPPPSVYHPPPMAHLSQAARQPQQHAVRQLPPLQAAPHHLATSGISPPPSLSLLQALHCISYSSLPGD